MNPNSSDPSNTPPAEDVTPEITPNPEALDAPVAPETPSEAASPFTAGTPESTDPVVAPVGTTATFTASGAPEAPKKSPKKIILIASIVGGVLLLAVIGVVVYLLLTTVSKDDYRAAAKQFNEVSRASSSLNSDVSSLSYSSGSTSDSTFDGNMKETEESLATLKSTNEELAKLKAVQVGEGATLYKAFNDKLTAYTAYGSDLLTSVKALRPALVVCESAGDATETAARIAELKNCSEALGKVTDLPSTEFKTFVTELKDSYAKLATVSQSIAGITDPYGDQYDEYKQIRTDLYAVQDKISAASKAFTAALKEHDAQVSVKDTAEALADYLNEQQK